MESTTRLFSCLITMAALTAGAHGAAPIQLPSGGKETVSFGRNRASTRFVKTGDAKANSEWTKSEEGIPAGDTLRVTILARPKVAWNTQVVLPVKRAFRKDDTLLLSFWIRSPKSEDESGTGIAAIYVQPGGKLPRYGFSLTANKTWQQWVRPFKAPAGSTKSANIAIHLGALPQIIELADVRLVNYGPDCELTKLPGSRLSYPGRNENATWRKNALARIEKIRKSDLTVHVLDSAGNPAPGAQVKVEMLRHAFPFGTAVNTFMLGGEKSDFPFTRNRRGQAAKVCTYEDAQTYRQIVKRYFNRITFEGALRPHVWKLMNTNNERWQRQFDVLTKYTVPWLQANRIDIRGHYIGWGAMGFPPLQKDFVGNPAGHRKWLWEHMADVLPRTREWVCEWDTINHIVGWGKTYESEYGGLQIHADIMKEARRLAPRAVHAINEGQILPGGSRRNDYKRIIKFLNAAGQKPDVVGFMAHFTSSSLTPPEQILRIYDDYAALAPKLQVTELDVDTNGDDELQADYFRDFLIASFSHPNIVAIVQWGFWENQHWKPRAALWRSDWSLKPAGKVFVDLVSKRWWTHETGQTAADGCCRFRGFHGDYKITAECDGRTAEATMALGKAGSSIKLQLK